MKFKIGDSVRVKPLDDSRASDYLADLQSCLLEGDIIGTKYDKIYKAMEAVQEEESPVFTISEIGQDDYALKLGKTDLPFMFDESGLEAV